MGGWVVEHCDIHDNATGGIRVGDRTRVLHSRVHHNGRIGILGSGDDIRIEDNEIAYNNADARYDMYDEAGGTKFIRTRDLVVRSNAVHHNHGPGLWTDIDNVRTLYENNRVEDNAEAGIFHEISYAATIRDNVVRRNGTTRCRADWISGAGILIGCRATSRSSATRRGQPARDHRVPAGASRRRALRRVRAREQPCARQHDRHAARRHGRRHRGWRRLLDRVTYEARGNRFWSNHYRLLGSGTDWFYWRGARRTVEQWRAFGQDSGSTIERR